MKDLFDEKSVLKLKLLKHFRSMNHVIENKYAKKC